MAGRDARQDERGVRPALLRTASPSPAALAQDREQALLLTPVSRETEARLDRFVPFVLNWQRRLNLIAPSTEPIMWTRHVADSLQLLALAPDARIWADLGSGGGFPGLVIACALADTPGARVHLVESNGRKAEFLREAAGSLGLPANVHAIRIADFVKAPPEPIEAVTARAVAPLGELVTMAYPLLINGALGLFPKGQAVEVELTEATKCWKIHATLASSLTDPKARIVVVRKVEPISARRAKRNRTGARMRGRQP